MTADLVDLTDVDAFVRGEHLAMFRWLREHDPVHWHAFDAGAGFWALTRHLDVSAAYVDHGTFLSSGGAMLGGSFRRESDSAAGRMLVSSDPPRHRLLRQLVHRAFTPDVLDRVGARVTRLVDAAIDRALADGGADFATAVAVELPTGALMEMMAIGAAEARHLIELTRNMIRFRDFSDGALSAQERIRLAAVQSEILEFFYDLLLERRDRPGRDVVSLLATADLNGRPLPEEDILYNCLNLAVGGNETTSHTASSGVVALAEQPAQYARLMAEPALLGSAVNEVLRWASTNAYVQRIAARDVEIGGRVIRQGDPVTLWNISANRDPAQFPEPDRFLVDRTPNRHLSYGNGIHRCIGAGLGQLELTILFNKMISERVRFEIVGEVARVRSNFIFGIDHLPLKMWRE